MTTPTSHFLDDDRLLVAKYAAPPLPPDVIARPEVTALLGERRVTVVSAPPGYGKTTLVRQWLASAGLPTAWITLDDGDNDPAVFLAYLEAAVRHAIPEWQPRHRPATALEERLRSVVNGLAVRGAPLRIVLDDYHEVRSVAVHSLVQQLTRHLRLPAGLVIISREDPPLPLGRLRSSGELGEVRASDLQFGPEAGARLLRSGLARPISDDDARIVVERADGWPAALRLAALTLRGADDPSAAAAAFGGSDRYLLEYLTEEVLDQQPAPVRSFLEATAVAEWLSADLCDVLWGRPGSRAILERLEASNLLAARFDADGTSWRYHPLIADMLRAGLDPVRRAELERVAATWFARHGMPSQAIRHAMRAGAAELACDVIEDAGEPTLARGEFVTVAGWCEALPAELVATRPAVRVLLAWAKFMLGDFAGAVAAVDGIGSTDGADPIVVGRLRCLEAWIANRRDDPLSEQRARTAIEATTGDGATFRCLAYITLGEALIGTDAQAARAAFEQAHRLAGRDAPVALRFSTVYNLALAMLTQGCRHEAEALLRDALASSATGGRQPPAAGMAYLLLGVARYEADDLEAARQHIATGWELCDRGRMRTLMLGAAEWHEVLALHTLGHRDQAWKRVDAVRRTARAHGLRRIERGMSVLAAELLLREGDLRGAQARMAEGSTDERLLGAVGDRRRMTEARIAFALGEMGRTLDLTGALLESQQIGNRTGRSTETQVLRAAALDRSRRLTEALPLLEAAVTACADQDRLSVLLDPVLDVARVLPSVRHVAPAFVDEVLRRRQHPRAAGQRPRDDGSHASGDDPYLEPMSARELEVLRLVVAGLSNAEIARELFVTPGTAKWHVHNLLGKSAARDRVGLVAWAHARGLA